MATDRNRSPRKARTLKQNVIRTTINALIWLGAVTLYYIVYSLFFDTPSEYELKHSTDRLRSEYELLEARYDSLLAVADNIAERDRNVFRTLFETDPYDFERENRTERTTRYEEILNRPTHRLKNELDTRTQQMEERMKVLARSYRSLQRQIDSMGSACNNIPAIQPVINHQLSLLTASYGMRIHPFYKTLKSHQGVDYTIPEGSRVFATADGRVKEVSSRNSTAGLTVVIDHGNGFETSYNHLGRINVKRGQEVRRGDIIALSGNTGLSLSPHLHYEVRHNGMRVDPIHYFFLELSPAEYQRMLRIARSGMQSFD